MNIQNTLKNNLPRSPNLGGYLNLIELENAGGLKEDQWEIASLQNWLQVKYIPIW